MKFSPIGLFRRFFAFTISKSKVKPASSIIDAQNPNG